MNSIQKLEWAIIRAVWPHLPVCVIGAVYRYHRAHRVLIVR